MENSKFTKDYTPLTPPEKKAVKLIMENLTSDQPISNKELQRQVGQEVVLPELLKNAHAQNEFKPVVKSLESLRQRAMDRLNEMSMDNVDYNDLINGIDKLTKNIQLLSGEDTERTQHTFSWQAPALPQSAHILPNGQYNNPLLAEKLGNEAPPLPAEVESLRIAQAGGQDRSHLESLTERRAFDPE